MPTRFWCRGARGTLVRGAWAEPQPVALSMLRDSPAAAGDESSSIPSVSASARRYRSSGQSLRASEVSVRSIVIIQIMSPWWAAASASLTAWSATGAPWRTASFQRRQIPRFSRARVVGILALGFSKAWSAEPVTNCELHRSCLQSSTSTSSDLLSYLSTDPNANRRWRGQATFQHQDANDMRYRTGGSVQAVAAAPAATAKPSREVFT
jgi:hypothetical protein